MFCKNILQLLKHLFIKKKLNTIYYYRVVKCSYTTESPKYINEQISVKHFKSLQLLFFNLSICLIFDSSVIIRNVSNTILKLITFICVILLLQQNLVCGCT